MSKETPHEPYAEAQSVPANVFGVWVSGVTENGPTAAAGLQEGDIITAIDEQAVRSFDDLVSYLFNNTTPGQTVTLTFVRNGSEQTALNLRRPPWKTAAVVPCGSSL